MILMKLKILKLHFYNYENYKIIYLTRYENIALLKLENYFENNIFLNSFLSFLRHFLQHFIVSFSDLFSIYIILT